MVYLKTHKISAIVNRPRTSVHYIIKKYEVKKSVENKARSSRSKHFAEVAERWLVRQIKKDPKTNASNLTKVTKDCWDIDVTPQTVRNHLHNNEFQARTARKKP
ncbi:hypothetical protein TNIN_237161 [Trichonephila inaurata madagascariensis]|uniref:Transposase Tc1-like domain-containing protein n=1 Tax=Trichonephila inaurata madagascariensis TaxID=2747483 RepID=A0A8X6XLZ8_9ARAC|nr:hypothetical protein TNIN_237161 [Trichonephila inaurata madagascariensis]